MSPMSSSFAPVVTGAPNDHHHSTHQTFSLVFWPILFGVFLIALIWASWKWKAGSWISQSPLSTPKPSTSAVARMARIRSPPVFGRPLATVGSRSSIPNPPPPVYIYPPRYDDIQGAIR